MGNLSLNATFTLLKSREKKLIVIAGPTAVGKTDFAVAVAKKMKTEIISADSRQIFHELEIGTAKPPAETLGEVKHHFINSHSITEEYDAAQFAVDALRVIAEVFKRTSVCVMCGGSGLYIKSVCEGFDDIPEIPADIRNNLISLYHSNGLPHLQQMMRDLDPLYFEKVDQQNPHRLIRALEVKIGTGKSLESFFGKQNIAREFDIVKIGLELPREILYQRIDARMDDMITRGLFEEAQSLQRYRTHQALQTVGYKEIFDYLDGLYDKDEAIRMLKQNSRRYAKRQLTWFKKDKAFTWFDARNGADAMSFIEKETAPIH